MSPVRSRQCVAGRVIADLEPDCGCFAPFVVEEALVPEDSRGEGPAVPQLCGTESRLLCGLPGVHPFAGDRVRRLVDACQLRARVLFEAVHRLRMLVDN